MNYAIANLFPDHLVSAFSRTLIHSLWQGALLAVVTLLLMAGTRKSSSARRYNLLVAAMALFAVVVAGTFMIEFNQAGAGVQVTAAYQVVNTGPVVAGAGVYQATPRAAIAETIGVYINQYAATIVWIWLLVVCVRCVQMLAGLHGVYSLRHKDRFSIEGDWDERMAQIARQLGIKRLVGIAQSARVKTPIVIGHLKPLILVPIGMLASLSTEEAEAILLHELAHIRRADYLVNLLQNLMEIVFFFNPAVLWLSALIRAERENCCDDMALTRSSKVNYLKALVACDEYNQPSPAYAMALKGGNGSLKNRVMRIVSNKNLSLNGREKSLLAACLITAGLFATAFANGERLHKLVIAVHKTAAMYSPKKTGVQAAKPIAAPAEQEMNTTPKINAVQPDTIKKARGNSSDTDRTKSMISDLLKDGIITSADGLSFKIGSTEFVVNYIKQPEAVYQKYRARYVPENQQGDWAWFSDFDIEKYAAIVANRDNAAAETPKAKLAPLAHLTQETTIAREAVPANDHSRVWDKYKASTDDEHTKSMIGDLLNDGIITSADNLSFKIGTDEFVVNYKKQPEAVYQKYRAKYVVDHQQGDWIWFYQFDSQKYSAIVADKHRTAGNTDDSQAPGVKTGVFNGKLN